MINSGMLLQPIMDPLARSDVSIGQSPCDLVPARPKLSVQMPFRDRKGVGTRATVIPAGFWRAELSKEMVLEGFQLILDYHSSMPRNFCGFFSGKFRRAAAWTLQVCPKLFQRFVSMHIASISCSFWAGLQAQSPANTSLRTAKFWPSGQAKEKSTRMLSASARVPGGSAAPRGTLGSRVQA